MLLLLMIALAADEPPRETNVAVSSQQSLVALQACATRKLARSGRVTPIPEPNGVNLDWQITGPFSASQAVFSLRILDDSRARTLSPLYRHPFSRKTALKSFRSVAEACFGEEYNGAITSNPELKPIG